MTGDESPDSNERRDREDAAQPDEQVPDGGDDESPADEVDSESTEPSEVGSGDDADDVADWMTTRRALLVASGIGGAAVVGVGVTTTDWPAQYGYGGSDVESGSSSDPIGSGPDDGTGVDGPDGSTGDDIDGDRGSSGESGDDTETDDEAGSTTPEDEYGVQGYGQYGYGGVPP